MVSSLASCFAALLVISVSILTTTTNAFQISPSTPLLQVRRTTSSSSASALLASAPRFDKATEKWIVTDPETQGPSAGYNIIGSLYRAGPVPVVTRIFNGEQYEQAVLKFMAAEGCDRVEAQGNMDAYFENPQDWAYQKLQEQNGAAKKDYANTNMQPGQIVLSTVWAGVVFYFAYYFITGLAEGKWGKAEGTDILHGNLWNLPF